MAFNSHSKLKERTHKKYNYTCQYCFIYLGDEYKKYLAGQRTRKRVGLTVDHIVPLSKGGKWELSNLVTCCEPCNSSKGDNEAIVPALKVV